jgi:hypothetical protein
VPRCAGCLPLLALLAVGCGRGALPDPRQAAEEYRASLAANDARRLRALLSREARQAVDEAELEQALARERAELLERAERFAAPGARLEISADLAAGAAGPVQLVDQGEGFRLRGAGALPPRPADPRAALVLLRRALEAGSVDAVVVLMSESARAELAEWVEGLAGSLEELDAAEIDVRGEDATVTLPDGQIVALRRERGAWRVEGLR